jgi:hypothetical protein
VVSVSSFAVSNAATVSGGLKSEPAEESLKRFQLDPGMKIELVAAEPDVAQPVYITFDERGRMWVVQYLKFPFPAGLKIVGHDRFWRVKYDKFPPPAPPNHVRGADKVIELSKLGQSFR